MNLGTVLRDFAIAYLPARFASDRLLRTLYGHRKPTFIFLTHPRSLEDIYHLMPIFRGLKRFLPESWLLKILSLCPCYVTAHVTSKEGLLGIFLSTPLLPSELFSKRSQTLKVTGHIIEFIRKITSSQVYVGLAAWWPIVTDGGKAFRRFIAPGDRIIVTNGHCATLASIVMSIDKICALGGLSVSDARILVIGVGKMGGAVAEAFNNKCASIGLIDQNEIKMQRFAAWLKQGKSTTQIDVISVSDDDFESKVIPALESYDVAVCTTSNIGYVIRDERKLKNCIILDDARPEAFPRIVDSSRNAVVLEGGLIKVPGIQMDSDFGFGKNENIFGCLAEAFILNLDQLRTVRPTLGGVAPENFEAFLRTCRRYGITEGDFKSGQRIVEPSLIGQILRHKRAMVANNGVIKT